MLSIIFRNVTCEGFLSIINVGLCANNKVCECEVGDTSTRQTPSENALIKKANLMLENKRDKPESKIILDGHNILIAAPESLRPTLLLNVIKYLSKINQEKISIFTIEKLKSY